MVSAVRNQTQPGKGLSWAADDCAVCAGQEHQEAGTEMQLAKLQGELAQQKRQCLMQSHRLARLEQELAEVKAFLGCLNQTLDEARRSSDKPPAKVPPLHLSACRLDQSFVMTPGNIADTMSFFPSAGCEIWPHAMPRHSHFEF